MPIADYDSLKHLVLTPVEGSSANQEVPDAQSGSGSANPADADLLDAYSRAVISVVRKVGPSVISILGPHGDERGGTGSGFILTPDGYALTNSHVVHGRDRLRAVTPEGDSLAADLIGDDPPTDLALVRLSARDLPLAELGDSRKPASGTIGDRHGQSALDSSRPFRPAS